MFSTNQINYIDTFLATYIPEGYDYYIAYTDTNTGSSYYQTSPDLYIVFSKEEIIASDGYSYIIPKESIRLSILTGNYSSNSSSNNSERVVSSSIKQEEQLIIDSYEHIYTNAKFEAYALQPDYYKASGGETNVQVKTISFILLVVFIYILVSKLWSRR